MPGGRTQPAPTKTRVVTRRAAGTPGRRQLAEMAAARRAAGGRMARAGSATSCWARRQRAGPAKPACTRSERKYA